MALGCGAEVGKVGSGTRAQAHAREVERYLETQRMLQPYARACDEGALSDVSESCAERRMAQVQKESASLLRRGSGQASASVDHEWAGVGQRFPLQADVRSIADIRTK